jgi:hypothetical protein
VDAVALPHPLHEADHRAHRPLEWGEEREHSPLEEREAVAPVHLVADRAQVEQQQPHEEEASPSGVDEDAHDLAISRG